MAIPTDGLDKRENKTDKNFCRLIQNGKDGQGGRDKTAARDHDWHQNESILCSIANISNQGEAGYVNDEEMEQFTSLEWVEKVHIFEEKALANIPLKRV